MKIRTQYYLAFLSSLIITFAVAAAAIWGVSNLKSTTDYLPSHQKRASQFGPALF